MGGVERKKQLGQYFTDRKVGRLLAALADADSAKSIIDPMVGSANLLQACLSIGANPDLMVGVELDPKAFAQARLALDGVENTEVILGDAFAVTLPASQFDLVIMNPPYIRYQSKAKVDGFSVPTSSTVRAGLLNALKARVELSEEELAIWTSAALEYPGTSDIAVPSWILGASLVKEGGILAVVTPKVWLSRNYAHAVRKLIDQAFDVEIILEDGDASWFPDAQVRTQLVIARRRSISSNRVASETVVARADHDFIRDDTFCGLLCSEKEVAQTLRKVTAKNPISVTPGLIAHVESGALLLNPKNDVQIPSQLAASLGVGEIPLRTLESYGWKIGQGFRSGANDFFYVDMIDNVVRPAERWRINDLPIPDECLIPAVRRQSDLGDNISVDLSQLQSRVVSLQGWATKHDMEQMSSGSVRVLPEAVADWIDKVAESPLSLKNPTKLFPDLSAVETNRKIDKTGRLIKFWYQLPEFVPRHRPALFLGRVCGGRPKVYLNRSRFIVDANFSGFFPYTNDALPVEAVLALLNSSWVWANLELLCTVLGGGALKIEATDMRRLPLPELDATTVQKLTVLGSQLIHNPSDKVKAAIDKEISACIDIPLSSGEITTKLRMLAERFLLQRT